MNKRPTRLMAVLTSLCLLLTSLPSVTAAAQADEPEVLPLDFMQYTSVYRECRQIPCEALDGIYFLNHDQLLFYSLETRQAQLVHTFDDGTIRSSFTANDKLYVISGFYKKVDEQYRSMTAVCVFDLLSGQVERTLECDAYMVAVGADDRGRIYLAGGTANDDGLYPVYLYAPEGTLIAQTESATPILDFAGFDSENGNMYFECAYNWRYWGYDHDMRAVGVGRVTGDTLTICAADKMVAMTNLLNPSNNAGLISQRYFYESQYALELIGGRYLCSDSSFSGQLHVWDSHALDIQADSYREALTLGRDNWESDTFDATASVGIRTVYREATNSLVTYNTSRTLTEYDMATGERLREIATAHPVFALMTYGDSLIALEKETATEDQQQAAFYLEIFPWKVATSITITGDSDTLEVGTAMPLQAVTDSTLSDRVTWSSSDTTVASVTQAGKVFGWKTGQAVITACLPSGLSASFSLTVTDNVALPDRAVPAVTLDGVASDNAADNDYTVWSRPVRSYLTQNADGTLTRVEYTAGDVVAETYTADGSTRISRQTLPLELPLFGGFYAGSTAYYLVFGQTNETESDETEVMRVVQYSKNWERLGETAVYGANTYIPFEGGSLRMTETAGKLYVYTCHEMYQSSDGYHHQANMTYVINETDMTVEQSYYDVMNISYGYVSHSFNQFIQTDGTYVYRVDHGDAHPRAVSLTQCLVDGSITRVGYTQPFPITGAAGNNATGVSVGGFELSSDACLVAGNAVEQTEGANIYSGQRNIFVTVTSKDLLETQTIWLTDYAADAAVTVRTPQLVKLGDDQFLVLWEEVTGGRVTVKRVTMDGGGQLTSAVTAAPMRLSDCQPILCRDGLVRWYVSTGAAPTLYTVNPYTDADAYTPGDVNQDGTVTAADALLALQAATGKVALDGIPARAADVDGTAGISANDALLILQYATQKIHFFA